nr:unnamed protein product [Callosobruchus chinensis]
MITKDKLGNRSTMKKPKNVTLDKALYIWYCQNHEQDLHISGLKLQATALKLNEELGGDPAFTASKGWLHRWKKRHGLRELEVSVTFVI